MTNKIFETSSLVAKNNAERTQRILFAALSGFLVGTIASVVSDLINLWLYPDLPIYVEWSTVFISWLLWSVLGGFLAGLAALSSEGWMSILLSAFSMAATILIINFVQGIDSIFLNLLVLLGLALPFTAIMTPLAYIFFWLARRFVHALYENGWARRKVFLVNFVIIIVLGLIPGIYGKMNPKAEQAVYIIHGILQDASQASSPDEYQTPLLKTEGFPEHADQPYTLSQVPSVYSTVGIDVTAHYEDDYTILCTVVIYPGSDPSIIPCKGKTP